jgi:hypothetical protein
VEESDHTKEPHQWEYHFQIETSIELAVSRQNNSRPDSEHEQCADKGIQAALTRASLQLHPAPKAWQLCYCYIMMTQSVTA